MMTLDLILLYIYGGLCITMLIIIGAGMVLDLRMLDDE